MVQGTVVTNILFDMTLSIAIADDLATLMKESIHQLRLDFSRTLILMLSHTIDLLLNENNVHKSKSNL